VYRGLAVVALPSRFARFLSRRLTLLALFGLTLLLMGCAAASASRSITRGAELALYDFTQPGSFEEGNYSGASLRVREGVYNINVTTGDNTLWWGQWGDTYTDTVIDVDVQQLSERNENAYGVMCRVRGAVGQRRTPDPTLVAVQTDTPATAEATEAAAAEATAEATETATAEATEAATAEATEAATAEATEAATGEPDFAPNPELATYANGDGYLFLIQGNGAYGIFRSQGRSLTPLVDWATSDAINRGPAQNRIRAVCVGTYLAMYVNGQFLAEATDDAYSQGQVGLAASAANRLGLAVQFDNLSIAAPASSS
jgi:hypothetical protein